MRTRAHAQSRASVRFDVTKRKHESMQRTVSAMWTRAAAMAALTIGAACSDDRSDIRPRAELDDDDDDDVDDVTAERDDGAARRPARSDGTTPTAPGAGVTTFDPTAAVPGFAVDIALGGVTGEDVVLDWSSGGYNGDAIVYRSADADALLDVVAGDPLPPGVTATSVSGTASWSDVGAASRSLATPHYFYRVGLVPQPGALQLSTMVMKTTTATYAGYNTVGMCMLDGPGSASELGASFGAAVTTVFLWDAETQSFDTWTPSGGDDFAIPYGAAVVVQLDGTAAAYQSLVGTVPTNEAMAVTGQPGNNHTTIPVFFEGPTAVSYWVDQVHFWGVGRWSNAAQSIAWYWGPGYDDFELEPCGAYEMYLPPNGCSSDADCEGGQRCYFEEGAVCGDVIAGLCIDPPQDECDLPPSPVCGCDGVLYDTSCDAYVAGTSVRRSGSGGGGELVFDLEGPVSPLVDSTGGWGRYDAAPASQTHAAVQFPSQVLGTDGNRSAPYPGSDNESSFATIGPITLGQSLSLSSWHVDEGGSYYDRKRIHFQADTGETWALVDCNTGLNPQAFCTANDSSRPGDDWDAIVLDTAILSGQTGNLRFEYETVDGCCSFEQGWYVDDIAIGECSMELTGGPPQQVAGPDECPAACLDMIMFGELVLADDPEVGSCYVFDYGAGGSAQMNGGDGGYVLVYWDDFWGQCQSQAPGGSLVYENVLGSQAAVCGQLVVDQIDALDCG